MTQYGSETILPYNKEEQKGTQVKRMFDSIAETYDQLNHTLSFGIDKIWRRKGIAFLRPFSPKTILDIATGTGDLAISMYKKLRPDHIIGADISLGMMEVGRKKVAAAGYSEHISFEQQDCTALTYEENSFDAVTAAFGVRNFENIEQGISDVPGAETRWAYHDLGTFHTGTFSHETTLPDLFKDRHPLYRTSTL